MLILRRVIFYLFLFAYLVLCPVLLLYASGYIFNPLAHEVQQTGLIYLSTTPSGARIYLGQSRFVNTTPASLDKLLPGRYQVALDLPGYRPWVQDVLVKGGEAAAFEKILLVARTFSSRQVLEGSFKQLIPLSGTDFILVSKDANLGSFQLYNWKNEKSIPIVEEGAPLSGFPVLTVFHEDDSRVFIVYGGGLWERKYLHFEIKGDAVVMSDMTKLFSKDPLLIKWDPANIKDVFAVYANSIDRLDVVSGAVYPQYLENVKGCGFHNNKIFLMTVNNDFLKYGYDKGEGTPFLESVHFDKSMLEKNVFYHIFTFEDLVVLLGEDGSLLINYLPLKLAAQGVAGVKFHERSKTLMYWTRTGIMLGQISRDKDIESGARRMVTSAIHTGGEDIKQCFWVLDNAHILCNDNDKIYLIEVEPQGKEHKEFIAAIKKGSSIDYRNETGTVYFLDENSQLKNLQIVPEGGLVGQLLNKGQGGR